MSESLDLGFINRTLKTTGVVLLIFFPFGIHYLGFYPSLSVISGGVWGMINLMLLARLVCAAIRPDGVDKAEITRVALGQFPLLMVAGYFLATTPIFDPLTILIGFSALLAVMVLKVIARVLLGSDKNAAAKRENLQGAV